MAMPDPKEQVLAGGTSSNLDSRTVAGFGAEWSAFDQGRDLSPVIREQIFDDYFGIFPWQSLPPGGGIGADVGCGSGRWAMLIAPQVKHLHVIDVSPQALAVARRNLASLPNVSFHEASVDSLPLPDASLDFAYSLGVLHHIPDTYRGIIDIVSKLKPGAPFLVYLYYAFDNRPGWFLRLWKLSDFARGLISRSPYLVRYWASQVIALCVYWPLARTAKLLELGRALPKAWPLAYYRDKSTYVMRTDAFDRFCTALEHRFTRQQIENMLLKAGLCDIRFSDHEPFWCAVGFKCTPLPRND